MSGRPRFRGRPAASLEPRPAAGSRARHRTNARSAALLAAAMRAAAALLHRLVAHLLVGLRHQLVEVLALRGLAAALLVLRAGLALLARVLAGRRAALALLLRVHGRSLKLDERGRPWRAARPRNAATAIPAGLATGRGRAVQCPLVLSRLASRDTVLRRPPTAGLGRQRHHRDAGARARPGLDRPRGRRPGRAG